MRIGAVCNLPPSFGGAEVLAKELILQLHDLGATINVITHRDYRIQLIEGLGETGYPFDAAQHRDILERGVAVHPAFDTVLTGKVPDGLDIEFMDTLRRMIQAREIDLLHCHFTTGRIREVFKVARDTTTPLVVTYHGMTNLRYMYDSFVFRDFEQDELLDLLSAASSNVVVSDEMLRHCRQHGIENVSRISGGVNHRYFHEDGARSRRGIVYVGKLNRHKGLKEACEAYLRVSAAVDEPLYLIGRGTDRSSFEATWFFLDGDDRARLEHLIGTGRVMLRGELWPEDLREHYRQAKALVLPSLTEGFPMSVLEALACGTPAVASDVGSIPDVVRDGYNGYLVAPGDIEALAGAILAAVAGFGVLAPNCRASIENFTAEKMARAYHRLFRRLIPRIGLGTGPLPDRSSAL